MDNPMIFNNNDFYHFPCPAKLNLFLHIIGQRSDGYHELETVFQFLDYGDTLSVKITKQSSLHLLTPLKHVNNEDNLIIKAAKLLQEFTNTKLGAEFKIIKKLPMGGGLGGGSSNAATVLLALNKLWETKLSIQTLAKIGLSLGADVPIFIHGHSAFAQGIGEKITPFYPKEYFYLVCKPDCSISTEYIFNSAELTRNTNRLNINDINIEQCRNDCQSLVIKHHTKVAKLLAWLIEYAPSRMTGTGACIFSRFDSIEAANQVKLKLPDDVESFVAKGINNSPLHLTLKTLS
jgi:4-diphosphocytidyl-2-C-methyl-D-erythritol kinase